MPWSGSPAAVLADLLGGPREEPEWFGPAVAAVVGGSEAVLAAESPRALEEATVALVGAQVRRAVREHGRGLRFDWWYAKVSEALAAEVREDLDRGGDNWVGPWRLLHGLAAIGTPALASAPTGSIRKLSAAVARAGGASQPPWLRLVPRVAPGEVWLLRDAYGSRFGIIAGLSSDKSDPVVFLLDIDACGPVTVLNAGTYADVSESAAAWRSFAGVSADGARPRRVETADEVAVLAYADYDDNILHGGESDSALDNWFRANRRLRDLSDHFRRRGTPLPRPRSLYRDLDTEPLIEDFTAWYVDQHDAKPDTEAVAAIAYEWIEGALPGTWNAVSPHRVRHLRAVMSDWIDDRVTAAAHTLIPDWVRWHTEQSDLPEQLRVLSFAATDGSHDRPDLAAPCAP
ncbi:hypothetical protein Ga0074812_12520 [Parafrankia irregularis]|uniref:Uncharacterized protein n=1 Tax=Parafrankia irregularis TaxID=795642 RepID=A0A0S4QTQ9_9ACTN|nr:MULTISPECIES: hypothetical protein [Frankiaceae]KPM50855.1 hypothetical protein ACG83_38265 [Frankia sp. R43]MBE3204800.1 hypothetical protein [Parafrankia sp. CH37]CUU59131.1 hypothetical protein Ga0074812_12520 [Parafrankia irregularis]